MVLNKLEMRKKILKEIGFTKNIVDGEIKGNKQTTKKEDVKILHYLTENHRNVTIHNKTKRTVRELILEEIYDNNIEQIKKVRVRDSNPHRLEFWKEDYKQLMDVLGIRNDS